VQDEIASAVVAALKVQLLPNQTLTNRHLSNHPEAYNQYLLGNQFYNRQNPEDWRRAVAAYRQAIAIDPQYAAAYGALASAQGYLADNEGDRAAMQESIATADKAIALAPGLPDGYIARGIARLSHNKDWAGAKADLEKALALNASDSRVQIGYGRLLIALGNVPEAIAATRKAVDLDPLSSIAWAQLGRMLTASGQLPEAEDALARTLEISPESEYAQFHMGELQLLEGKPRDALVSFQKAGTYGPAGVAMAEYSLGHAKESQHALDEQIARYSQGAAYQVGEIYAWRGEKDKAFEWLDRAFDQHDGGLTFIKNDPLLASLRDDPRFAALMKKLGLPE
jgi:tetratricopeptide (TPR) repeat protein